MCVTEVLIEREKKKACDKEVQIQREWQADERRNINNEYRVQ